MLFFVPLVEGICQEDFRGWKQAETEHFTFIFEERDIAAVEELISFCEEVYDKIGNYFDYYPDRIHCIVRGRIDAANGSYAAFPNRITLYVTSPSGPWMGARTENWLRTLLIHEVVHYIHLSYNKGFFHILGEVFGKDLKVAQAGFQPGWMIEGIAVVLETELSKGGRGRNPFFELNWKAPILEDTLFSLRQASYQSAFPPRGRIYVAGYMLVSYMMDQFGNDVFRKIHREYVKFPLAGPRYAIKKVTGQSAEEIYDGMVTELQTRYRPYENLARGMLLSPEKTGNYYFPEITEGGWYLYRTALDNAPAIVQFDPETGNEEIIIQSSLTDSDSLSADGEGDVLYFASYVNALGGSAGQTITSDIYRWSRQTGRIEPITENARLWHPAVSEDGSLLVAVQGRGSYSRLVQVDPETGSVTPLFTPPGSSVYTPDISPDGSKIVFALNHRGVQDIWVYSFSGGTAEPVLGPDRDGDYYPRFTDTGTITFSSDRDGDIRLYEYSFDTGKLRELYRDRIAAYKGGVDKDRLIYGSYEDHGWSIRSVSPPRRTGESDSDALSAPEPAEGNTAEKAALSPPEMRPLPSATTFIDVPLPLAWAPVPAYLDPFNNSLPEDFGIGVFSYWASRLRGSELYGYVSFPFTKFQPSILLESSFYIGPLNIDYSYNQIYLERDPDFYQQLSEELILRLPVFARYKLGASASLSISSGLSHSYGMWRSSPFHLFNWFDFSGFDTRQRLFLINGGGFSIQKSATPRGRLSPLRLVTTLQSSVPLPVTADSPGGFALFHTLELQSRSFTPSQFIRLGISSNFTTESLLGSRSSKPRGAFASESQPRRGSSLFALDYLFSFGPFDQPLPIGYNMFGLNIQGILLGLHAEFISDWDAGSFSFDRYIYTGIELILDIGASLASVPVGFGLSFRFDRTFSAPVDITEDLRPYLFVGLDSFLSTLLEGRTGTEGAPGEQPPRITPDKLRPAAYPRRRGP